MGLEMSEWVEGIKFRCRGRDRDGNKVLDPKVGSENEAVRPNIKMRWAEFTGGENIIQIDTDCKFRYDGPSGKKMCSAAGDDKSKHGYCNMCVDLPLTLDMYQKTLRGIHKESDEPDPTQYFLRP